MIRHEKTVSLIASVFRDAYTVAQLERINLVTGSAYPISGDLWTIEGNGSRIEFE